jgi:hypothetical protein
MQKKIDGLTVFFAILGSACVKGARKMLMKLNSDADGDKGESNLLTQVLHDSRVSLN